MNLSKFRFTLDLHSIQSQASIPVMVGDTSVTLIISITDGGLPYHIEDGCLAKISIKRPTGTHLEEFCVVKNNAVVEYAFSQNENTCAVPGVHVCDIILYGADGGVVGTPRFTMVVSERVIRFDDIVLTDTDFTASEAMMKQEAVRQMQETTRQAQETTRQAQETTRQDQERMRVIAEEGRVAAEAERIAAGEVALNAATEAKEEAARAAESASQAKVEAELAADIVENFKEEDPTVPAWAKAEKKPTYTAAEVGALPNDAKLADLEGDAEHRTITDAERTLWNQMSGDGAGIKTESDPTVPAWAKNPNPPTETDPTVPAWAKNPNPPTPAEIGAAPAYSYGTADKTAGSSSLTTGTLYFVYE